jgi:hypothetical protein
LSTENSYDANAVQFERPAAANADIKVNDFLLVETATGHLDARSPEAGWSFAGVAVKRTDNTDGEAGDEQALYDAHGFRSVLRSQFATFNGFSDEGANVYMVTPSTFSLSDGGGANALVGVVHRAESDRVVIRFAGRGFN